MNDLSALEILKHPQSGDVSDIKEAIECAVNALEKQIPKKPIPQKVEIDKIKIGNANWCKGTTVYKCPNCNEHISRIYDYCYKCGQALLWEEKKCQK